MCSFNLFVALLFLLHCTMQSFVCSVDFHVGVILDLDSRDSSVGRIGMQSLSMALTDFYSLHADYKTRLVLHPVDSNGTVVDAAAAALHLLRDFKVDAIIGPQKSTQAIFVMDLGERAQVPIISFSATNPSLIHRTPYFVQAAQSDANQVQVIASIVNEFRWTQVVIIYEDTEFGSGIISYLSNALQDVHARVPYRSLLPRSATDDFISNELLKMMNMQTRVFVVHMSQFLAARLFLKARELWMMSEGFVWIVTSGLTDLFSSFGSDAAEAMEGVLGVRPLIPKSEGFDSFASRWRMVHQDNHDMKLAETSIFGAWAYDTLWALGLAAESVWNSRSNATDNANLTTETGPELLKALLKTRFTGLAGEFNLVSGQLVPTAYEVVNVVGSIERPVGKWTPTGGIIPSSSSKRNFGTIIWPGDPTKAPRGWEHPIKGNKLRIAVPEKPGFNNFLKVETDPQTKETTVTGLYKELFDAVMSALPYDLPHEFHPYQFFNSDGSRAGSYDDLVHQIYLQKDYDGALGDITITANRSNYVDFTMPYAEGGIACIVPIKYEDVNDAFTFLQPPTRQLWITTCVLYLSTAMITWMLAKRLVNSSRDSLIQRAGMTSLFPFFPGEGIQVSLIILILVSWGFVANLLNSTYTASLSSKLTVDRLQPTVKDVNQLMVNGDYVGCQEGSFLQSYLVKKGFDISKIKKYTTANDSIEALIRGNKKNGTSAYCDVLPHIRAILSNSCGKYMMIDPIFRTDGFAFVFPKGFPAIADISRAIVQVMENNSAISTIEQPLKCLVPDDNSSLARVSLHSFSVLFCFTGFVTLTCFLVSLLIDLHSKRPLHQRITDFNANACSRILAFRLYLRRKDHPSLPTATDDGDRISQVEEIYSNDHVMEIEVIPH